MQFVFCRSLIRTSCCACWKQLHTLTLTTPRQTTPCYFQHVHALVHFHMHACTSTNNHFSNEGEATLARPNQTSQHLLTSYVYKYLDLDIPKVIGTTLSCFYWVFDSRRSWKNLVLHWKFNICSVCWRAVRVTWHSRYYVVDCAS